MINNRTMVKVKCTGNILDLRTISRDRKSPRSFSILRGTFQQIEQEPGRRLITEDCGSFAVLQLENIPGRPQMLVIQFTWLQSGCADTVSGWTEWVRLPYARFHEFVDKPGEVQDTEWRLLSIPKTVTRRIEFQSRQKLHDVVQHPILRHKLGKVLERHFQWKESDKIVIYDERLPFSFFFQEYTPWGSGICGGIILSGTETLRTAVYGVHT